MIEDYKIGELIVMTQNGYPFYQKGDIGRLVVKTHNNIWYADFNNQGNASVYGDGVHMVGLSGDFKPQPVQNIKPDEQQPVEKVEAPAPIYKKLFWKFYILQDQPKPVEKEQPTYTPRSYHSSVADEYDAECKSDRTDKFLTSTVIGAVTGSSVIGGVVGGDLMGGLLGDVLEGGDDSLL